MLSKGKKLSSESRIILCVLCCVVCVQCFRGSTNVYFLLAQSLLNSKWKFAKHQKGGNWSCMSLIHSWGEPQYGFVTCLITFVLFIIVYWVSIMIAHLWIKFWIDSFLACKIQLLHLSLIMMVLVNCMSQWNKNHMCVIGSS